MIWSLAPVVHLNIHCLRTRYPRERHIGSGNILREPAVQATLYSCEYNELRIFSDVPHHDTPVKLSTPNIMCQHMIKQSVLALLLATAASLCDASETHWTGGWYASPVEFAPQFSNATFRTVLHVTTGGDRLRLRISNLYGHTPLRVGSVYMSTGNIGKSVTFNGAPQVSINPGDVSASDPVEIKIAPGAEITVSVFYPEEIPQELTLHFGAADSNMIVPGNAAVSGASLAIAGTPVFATYFLVGVDVDDAESRGTIVALGDSITEGGTDRWPALLAQRLSDAGKRYGVVNAGIGGNRLLSDVKGVSGIYGQSALSRFDREVLEQPTARYVIVYEGINDLGLGETSQLDGSRPPQLADLVAAIRRLATRAHRQGIKIYAATLGPFEGARNPTYYSSRKNTLRGEINHWIRTSKDVDGYFDFDHALADPDHPNRLNPEYDSGDHLHPNPEGERALSQAVDISKFD